MILVTEVLVGTYGGTSGVTLLKRDISGNRFSYTAYEVCMVISKSPFIFGIFEQNINIVTPVDDRCFENLDP